MCVLGEAVAVRQARNGVTLARRVRIVGSSEDDAERDATIPFGLDLVERAGDGVLQQVDEVRLQPHHDRLRFRVAHAAVEFERFDSAILADHQPGVEEAGVGDAVAFHAAYGRQDDLAHGFGVDFRSHHRSRRIGAHAAGVRAGVAVTDALVVLAGGQCQNVLAVDHDDEAGFLAFQKLLDDDACSCFAQFVAGEHVVDGGVCLFERHGHNDTLAGREAVGLDDDWCTNAIDVGVCGGGVGEGLEESRRDLVPGHETLGKVLR